jgi:hypothetical protein
MTPALFVLIFYGHRVLFFAQAPLGLNTPMLFMLSTIAGITGAHHQAQLLVEMGESHELFAWVGLKL